MEQMTKKELMKLAVSFDVDGRSGMSKEQLLDAVHTTEAEFIEDALAVQAEHLNEMAKEKKKYTRVVSENYVPTTPYQGRQYRVVGFNKEVYDKLPPQAKQIFDFMRDEKFTGRGCHIVEAAVAAGRLKTQQDPAVLFAFYARRLEAAGISISDFEEAEEA